MCGERGVTDNIGN